MTHRPFRLALTGSIGSGKSTVAAVFREAGVPVFDADAQVHRLQGPCGTLLPAIEARFPGTTGPQGVNRQLLGAQVLGKPAELRALEKIVHPAVAAARRDFLRRHAGHRLVLLDIPLLFETRGERTMDLVIMLSIPPFVQRHRVLRRKGMSETRLRNLRAAQMPDHQKRARADIIIGTARPKWQTRAEISLLLACLRRALSR